MTLLVYWGAAWLLGIWLGSLLGVPWLVWLGIGAVALLAARLAPAPKARLAFLCALGLALGAVRFSLAQPHFDATALASFNDGGAIVMTGVVAAEPDVRGDRVCYTVDAEHLAFEDEARAPLSVHGLALVCGSRYPSYTYGDRLQVRGNLETPPVLLDFNYREYLARRGIYSYVPFARLERLPGTGGSDWKRTMLAFKDRAQATIARIFPEPEASLLTGILLGVESGIPSDTMDAFSATGTTHVIVISGFNITIVVTLLMATVGRVLPNRWSAAGVAVLGVVAYTILVGADAAVVRAAAMGIVTVIGVAVGRPGLALNSLAVAVLVMTALNPNTLWDVGFQLSVAATLGLIVYGERFERAVERLLAHKLTPERAEQITGAISEALLLTLAAQVTTTPLILKYFGQLSVVTLLTNALILPVQPLVMLGGGAATLAGLVFEPLGQVLAWLAYLPLTWTIRVVEWTARFPRASVPLALSDLGLFLVYAAIAGGTYLACSPAERRTALWQGLRERLSLKLALGGMATVVAVAWLAVMPSPDGKLHVVFMDVGQGDAIWIETPGGAQILIDGGPEGSVLLAALGSQMPFWDRTLDLVVLTHPDADHLTGLVPALERYRVRAVLARQLPHETSLVAAWRAALATEGATLIRGEAGTRMTLSDGVTLEILHPGPDLVEGSSADSNNNSVVLRLVYQEVAFLLPGDIEADVEAALTRSGVDLPSTVLKVPHHGSKTSSSLAFIEAVQPQVAVISVGAENDFGHPSGDVLARLGGTLLYRTDAHGTVSISSDGHRLWIETER